MNLSFSPAAIPGAISGVLSFIRDNPIMCAFLFTYYAIFYLYSMVHHKSMDSDIYEADVLSNGISSIMTVFLLIGLDENAMGFSLTNLDFSLQTTLIAAFLFVYGGILILCAFTKILPRILVLILGNSELDLFINLVAVLMVDSSFEVTGTTLFVIGVPLAILFLVQRLRRKMG